jgi:hypothetical protein
VKQPPRENHASNNQQSENLVAPEGPPLLLAPRCFRCLLEMRLDAGFDHDAALLNRASGIAGSLASIGDRETPAVTGRFDFRRPYYRP